MIEVTGNLWDFPADVRVITTNGTIRKDGCCVMGRGCAAEAKKLWDGLPLQLGLHIKNHGNVVGCFQCYNPDVLLYSFPVKHNWYEKADIKLIEDSAHALVLQLSDGYDDDEVTVVLPRPGCGNGQLKWEVVKPILEPILDNRFHVITFK